MTITRVRTLCLSRLHEPERQWVTACYRTIKADAAIVVIETDEGLTGIGEASAYGWPLKIREWADWLSQDLLGHDPSEPDLAPRPTGHDRGHDCAVAGIDCALWDLRGKRAGRRVSELITPTPADRVRLYASSGCRYDWRAHPEQLIEETLGYIDAGYTAVKFRIGTEWAWDGVTVDHFLGLVRELAQAVDGRAELMLDGNCRLNFDQALAIAREIERLGFKWFEEPMPWSDIDANVRLCAAVDLPISGGESFATLEQMRPYLDRGAYDILQPDAGLSGLTESLRIARVAQRYGVTIAPHGWHNGLMAMAHAHYLASLPHPRPMEVCMIQGPLQWGLLAEPPVIENGWLVLPDRPGLGVELADDLEATFPHIEGHYAVTVQR